MVVGGRSRIGLGERGNTLGEGVGVRKPDFSGERLPSIVGMCSRSTNGVWSWTGVPTDGELELQPSAMRTQSSEPIPSVVWQVNSASPASGGLPK